MTAILEARGLTRRFGGISALRDVSFSVDPAEIVALIGPNGAGKTTCFNLIDGTLRPHAGEVRFAGMRVTGLAPEILARRGIGRTFQVAATFASMSVREGVALAVAAREHRDGRFLARPLALHSKEIDAILEQSGVSPLASRQCGSLAWGDAKRVELALARAGRPRLLLMDEPTAGVEPASRRVMMEAAVALAREDGAAILFTEHDMDMVFGFAERILVLDRGVLIANGTADEIRASEKVAKAYLGTATGVPARS